MHKLSAAVRTGGAGVRIEGGTVGNAPSPIARLRKAAGLVVTIVGIMFGLVSPSDALSD